MQSSGVRSNESLFLQVHMTALAVRYLGYLTAITTATPPGNAIMTTADVRVTASNEGPRLEPLTRRESGRIGELLVVLIGHGPAARLSIAPKRLDV